jgi:hypothetical protein
LTLREDQNDQSNADLTAFALVGTGDRKQALVEAVSSACQVSPDKIEDIYPCTPLQHGLIATSMIYPGKVVSCKKFTLPFNVDLARFKAAWATLVRHNQLLRTRAVQVESELLQVVVPIEWQTEGEDRQKPIHLGDPMVQVSISKSTEAA